MQDQGKRLLLAVLLAAGVWVVFTMLAPKRETPPAKPTATSNEPSKPGTPSGTPPGGVALGSDAAAPAAPSVGSASAPAANAAAEAPRPPEAILTLPFENV